jgi:hypothetical protein
MPDEFLGRVRTERARTVEPEAYYRDTARARHSIESGGYLMINFEQLPEYGRK